MAEKILVLEPYYGGSHKNFLDGLGSIWPGEIELVTLPARKWKWRMRLSGPWLAAELARRASVSGRTEWLCILCSTFVDVAAFKGLCPPWLKNIPLLTYFHENQFVYPVQVEDERDFHFALTNVTTALASEGLAFNSRYNYETFIDGCNDLMKKSYDMKLGDISSIIEQKTRIIPPGVDFRALDSLVPGPGAAKKPVIVWNHRWEHDKNPQEFFAALDIIDNDGLDFSLVVLGESFRDQPEVFALAEKRFSERILRFGYAENRDEYIKWLKIGDVVVSTAVHEFYGISIIEAVRAGCRPLLPNRLSYPELFPEEFLYDDGQLVDKLKSALTMPRLPHDQALALTERFAWSFLKESYIDWLSVR